VTEKCNCWSQKLEMLKEHIIPELPKHEELDIQWQGYAHFMSGDYSPVKGRVNVTYNGFKKNGNLKANMTKTEALLDFNFCPFCGRKYNKGD